MVFSDKFNESLKQLGHPHGGIFHRHCLLILVSLDNKADEIIEQRRNQRADCFSLTRAVRVNNFFYYADITFANLN